MLPSYHPMPITCAFSSRPQACARHVHGMCTARALLLFEAYTSFVQGPPLHMVAGLNLSGLSSGTVHRAVGVSSAGRVHDASWDTESLFLTLQVILTTATYLLWPLSLTPSADRCHAFITPMPQPHATGDPRPPQRRACAPGQLSGPCPA